MPDFLFASTAQKKPRSDERRLFCVAISDLKNEKFIGVCPVDFIKNVRERLVFYLVMASFARVQIQRSVM